MTPRRILLLRHCEAQKNVEDRHGGSGTSLTSKGFFQCSLIAEYLAKEYSTTNKLKLIGHNVPQVKSVVKHLSEKLDITPIWEEGLRGINLGVLAGLSRKEALQQWPEAAQRLELWRKKKMRIDQLNIPEAEPLDKFKSRVESVLKKWLNMRNWILLIAVCTHSTLIMLVNLIKLWGRFSYDSVPSLRICTRKPNCS